MWSEDVPWIAPARHPLTDRAARWATLQVGRWGRTVDEVADELGSCWHTVNDAVIAYGTVLVDQPDRIGDVVALGLDEVAFARVGRWKHRLRVTNGPTESMNTSSSASNASRSG